MNYQLTPKDIILSDASLLRLAVSAATEPGEGVAARAHFDVEMALQTLRDNPDLGARLLGSAPGDGTIFYNGDFASERLPDGRSMGVKVVSRRTGDEIVGDNVAGAFLGRVRDAYREYLLTHVPDEQEVRPGQIISDFIRKGAYLSDVEMREEDGEKFIHVDVYRPARFRFDAARNGTTGHASRRSGEDVPFQKFECPFGTSYPAPLIVGSAAEASFLYEKAIRGELDWEALFADLSNRGLMKKDVSERQKATLIGEYKAQFSWMRERICRDPELRRLPIVSSGLLVPDASLGRSVYDADLAPSPAHVLARYINNPVLLFTPAENSVFRSYGVEDKNELLSFRSAEGKKDAAPVVNILIIGSDVIGGREPGRKATTEAVRRKVRKEDGTETWEIRRELRIPMKGRALVERDYADFAARMDSVLADLPKGTAVRLVTGSSSTMGDGLGVGTPSMVKRYVEERGGVSVDLFDEKAAVPENGLTAVMAKHFADVLPVLTGAETSVSFPEDRDDVDSAMKTFGLQDIADRSLTASGAVCFTIRSDTNNRNVLSMGSYVASLGFPVIHVMDNSSVENQAAMLRTGAELSRASLSGDSVEGLHLLDGAVSREWNAGECNMLSYVDSHTGVAHPFVLNTYPGTVVVEGQSYHSAMGAYVALMAADCGKGDRQTLLAIAAAEGSLNELMDIYGRTVFSEGSPVDDAMMERNLRRSIRMMSVADSGFVSRLLELDGRDIVMPVSEDKYETGLFTGLDLKGGNRFGIILTDERALLVRQREERRAAMEAEMQLIAEEANRRQKVAVGARAEGQKIQGGFPASVPGKVDAVWFLGTNTPDQFVIPDGNHSFEMWDDENGDDPLTREKAVREDMKDYVILFPSDEQFVMGKGTVPRNPDSRNLTGVMRPDRDGNTFVCAFGIPVRKNNCGYEVNNDENLPCSYRLDNDAANFAESLVVADAAARHCALVKGLALCLPGRTLPNGIDIYSLGNVFKDKVFNHELHKFVSNPHRSPLNLELTERYIGILERGKPYPLNFIPMPQAEYPLDGSAEEVAARRKEAKDNERPYISAEGRFISDLLLSLRIANAQAVALGVPLRFPLDEKGRIDLGPGVPEEFRALAERRIDSFIGVVKEEDIIDTKLPVLERISLLDALKSVDSFEKAKDLYIRPNELVYAFGEYEFDNILLGRNAPLHEMAFRMEDGTVVMISDTKMTRGMDPSEVNKYLSYEKNDERRFMVRTTNLEKASEFISELRSYCERAKAVQVDMRLLSVKDMVSGKKSKGESLDHEETQSRGNDFSMEGYVKLFSSNSDEFATNEHEIGRTRTVFNGSNRFDGFDAEETYWGKVDANDGFEGYAQISYLLPDGTRSGWITVKDLELAKDMVMSMVRRVYRDERVVPSDAVMKMLVTAEAVKYAGDQFRNLDYVGTKREVDDKVVRLEDNVAVAPSVSTVRTERVERPAAPAAEEPEPENIVPSINFTESSGGYATRTAENANAKDVDFTIAFAVNFNTPGERRTALEAGDSLIKVKIPQTAGGGVDCSPTAVRAAVESIAESLPDEFLKGEEFGLNIAGNGLFTLAASGITQKQCDEFVTKVIAGLARKGAVISSLRSGGQTGIDESGAVAGVVLNIPTTVHSPKGWAYRCADGTDVRNEAVFKKRFLGKPYKSLRDMVSPRRREQAVKGNIISK